MQKKNYIPQNQYDLIKPAIEYVEENFLANKISVPFLADRCGISEAYLKKLFIKKFGMSSMEFAKKVLTDAKVALVPGSAFGPSGEGFVRASFSTSYENLVEAADRIESAISKW